MTEMPTKNYLTILAGAAAIFLLCGEAGADNVFNRLVLEKAGLEREFGVKSLECFPFADSLGEDQAVLVRNCLAGAETLKNALKEVPGADAQTVGIDSRFLRTGGFHTVLIPWNASKDEVAGFLRQRSSPAEQKRFLENVDLLKKGIQQRLGDRSIYCSQRISNDQCFLGYQTLSAGLSQSPSKETRWRAIVITGRGTGAEDPHALPLGFDFSVEEMTRALFQTDPNQIWSGRKKAYDLIQEKFGAVFRERLQLPNFFCSTGLTPEECLQGASNLHEASQDETLRSKLWGEAVINKHNTAIVNDFDVYIRYDLPADQIVRFFAGKPSREEAEKNAVLAEKLEKRIKGNASALRAVCDLVNLRSALCVKGLRNFAEFIKTHPDYRAAPPWTDAMFIDGSQLARVNFALNSSVRQQYIYIDADSSGEEMSAYLMNF